MKKHEEAIPTSVYNMDKQDEELPQSYDPAQVDDGYKPSFLYVERGPGAGQLVQIKQGPHVCGRASVSDLRLQHSSISRRHAQLTRAGERFYIKDLGSQNGTFVNKIKIATEIEIYPGDQIALGNALIKLRGPLQQAQAPASAKGELKVKADKSKVLTSTTKAKKSSTSVAKVAIFAGAVGFGLAGALMFALLSVPSSGPSFQTLPGAARPDSTKPASAAAPAKAAQVSEEDKAKVVDARLKEAMEEQKAKEAPRPAPAEDRVEAAEPSRGATAVAAHSKKAKRAPGTRVAAAGSKAAAADESEDTAEEDAPAAAESSPKRSAILAAYEKGDAEASLEAAKKAGDKDLVAKLSKFQAEYDAAGAAIGAKNGTAAIKHFDAALKLDEQLSSGWSKYGTEIRKQLSGLWTLVGFAHLEAENTDAARQAFAAALRHDPENTRAKGQMEKLGAGEKPAAKKQIDDAFADEEKPAEKPAAKAAPKAAPKATKAAPAEEATPRSSAIDQAFGD